MSSYLPLQVPPGSDQDVASGGCSPTLVYPALDRTTAQGIAEVLRAVADPARLQLISLLQSAAHGEACVCDLVAPLGLSQPTVSHHLKVLLDAGIVTRRRRGTWAYYRLVPERLSALAQFLGPTDAVVVPTLSTADPR